MTVRRWTLVSAVLLAVGVAFVLAHGHQPTAGAQGGSTVYLPSALRGRFSLGVPTAEPSATTAPTLEATPAPTEEMPTATATGASPTATEGAQPSPTTGAQASPTATTGAQPSATATTGPEPSPTTSGPGPTPTEKLDMTHLPVGDGKLSTQPEIGYVWPCSTQFNGGGAMHVGPWVHDDGTFDFTSKVSVDGAVDWPSQLSINLQGAFRVVTGNDLPSHPTGIYPIQRSDDAYQYDRNPNPIASQTVLWSLPANPEMAARSSCVGLGPVGVMTSGAYVFNALDAAGRDGLAHEVQDDCQGHPQGAGAYHYHSPSTCMDDPGTGHSELLGYAIDGFGIYGTRGEDGSEITTADLDECHGHTHEIEWDGQTVTMYHYHLTWDYPYTVGCYRGTPIQINDRPPRP